MTIHSNKPYGQLFLEHHDELERVARRIVGCPFQAEDIVQEAFFKFEKGNWGANLDRPVSYLARIVRNLSIDLLRRKKREARIFDHNVAADDMEFLVDPYSDPEAEMLQFSEYQRVLAALAELPDRTQQAVLLHMVQGYTVREIAERLNMSVGTAHRLIRDGTLHCQTRLSAE